MSTPLATMADALIEFILSLLRDPSAAAEFDEDPDGALARNGLSGACVDDVRAVAPVIVDHPAVHPRPDSHGGGGGHHYPGPPKPPGPPSVEKEISNITNNFSIENRVSNVDQSVNQNIWAEGDVNQIFDQEAVVNQGDGSVVAGEDADADYSNTDVTVGDVAIGNEETTTTVEESFDDESTDVDVEVEAEVDDSFNDESTNVSVDVQAEDSFQYTEDSSATMVADEAQPEPESEEQL